MGYMMVPMLGPGPESDLASAPGLGLASDLASAQGLDSASVDLPLYIQTHFLSYGCDNFLRINSRGERYPSALCG